MTTAQHGPWLRDLRRAAETRAQAQGLPSRRDEAWKYTDLAALGVAGFPVAGPDAGEMPAVPGLANAVRIVLVNGALAHLPEGIAGLAVDRLDGQGQAGVVQAHLGRAIPGDSKSLAAMNGALFTDGVVLRVTGVVAQPIEILSYGRAVDGALAFHPRCLVVVEENAQATLFERHLGQGRTFSNSVVEVSLAEGASLTHYVLQDEGPDAVHVGTLGVSLAAGAVYAGVLAQTGARLARREVHTALCGEDASFSLDGAYLGRGRQHIDNTTFVTHAAPGGASRQVFKGVLDDHARGVFQGSVLVERGAQRTNAHQLSKSLLLSAHAEMDGKPELEIYADDVKCGHGCTVGDIDEDALFYLRARGIGEAEARRLLIEAFLVDVLDRIDLPAVADTFSAAFVAHLARDPSQEKD
jgi:Fe-S cluster assembly protein SufD